MSATSVSNLLLACIVLFCIFVFCSLGKRKPDYYYKNRVAGALSNADDTKGKVIHRNTHTWVVDEDICDGIIEPDFILTHLQNTFNIPIYVYPANVDECISFDLIHTGHYEHYNVEKIINYMEKYPNAVFLDLGAYIGTFSLSIAALGYRVVAIECLKSSVKRMCASMKAAGVSDKMTIIHNALADKQSEVSLESEERNMGVTYIVKKITKEQVHAITLNDLTEIFNFDQVVMKIDVYKYEHFVLKGALEFFHQVKVEAILLEFVHHQSDADGNDGEFIVEFLREHDFEPDLPDEIKWDYKKWKTAEILFKRKQIV